MAFSLDGWGRIVEVHTPERGTERYTYDHAGNITSTTDANGGTITYDYNSMGKVYRVTDQEGCSNTSITTRKGGWKRAPTGTGTASARPGDSSGTSMPTTA